MEMARRMLKTKYLSKEYFAEAVAYATYILNRIPTRSVKDKISQESWSCEENSLHHFRTFGCVAYSLVPFKIRRKCDDKGEKCISIGYSEESKAYKLFNLIIKRVIVSRSIEFTEES